MRPSSQEEAEHVPTTMTFKNSGEKREASRRGKSSASIESSIERGVGSDLGGGEGLEPDRRQLTSA